MKTLKLIIKVIFFSIFFVIVQVITTLQGIYSGLEEMYSYCRCELSRNFSTYKRDIKKYYKEFKDNK